MLCSRKINVFGCVYIHLVFRLISTCERNQKWQKLLFYAWNEDVKPIYLILFWFSYKFRQLVFIAFKKKVHEHENCRLCFFFVSWVLCLEGEEEWTFKNGDWVGIEERVGWAACLKFVTVTIWTGHFDNCMVELSTSVLERILECMGYWIVKLSCSRKRSGHGLGKGERQ